MNMRKLATAFVAGIAFGAVAAADVPAERRLEKRLPEVQYGKIVVLGYIETRLHD